jgi:PHD/YefM family antitoxin component YafN of YafNO toxin-antitoxin module
MSYKMSMLAKRSAKTTSLKGRYVTDRQGKRTGVVLSLKRYSRLMEDLHDLAVVAERRKEKLLSADDMKNRLRKRGLL